MTNPAESEISVAEESITTALKLENQKQETTKDSVEGASQTTHANEHKDHSSHTNHHNEHKPHEHPDALHVYGEVLVKDNENANEPFPQRPLIPEPSPEEPSPEEPSPEEPSPEPSPSSEVPSESPTSSADLPAPTLPPATPPSNQPDPVFSSSESCQACQPTFPLIRNCSALIPSASVNLTMIVQMLPFYSCICRGDYQEIDKLQQCSNCLRSTGQQVFLNPHFYNVTNQHVKAMKQVCAETANGSKVPASAGNGAWDTLAQSSSWMALSAVIAVVLQLGAL
ncbi:hypothetical protein BGZ51_006741 [Haplosporangium sp. Z 767]|nr:hypothetical protein BGZ50_006769 [Haplosporangium sp. Z 11]KAF9179680.1 hypothetical protein BGZ51_006741 [Haplosporangium sp. Z 767]